MNDWKFVHAFSAVVEQHSFRKANSFIKSSAVKSQNNIIEICMYKISKYFCSFEGQYAGGNVRGCKLW
jgi:hypothetical protein